LNQRQDANLSADELNALRIKDCQRYLTEWTYRVLESPELSDDPESLLRYLCEQFEEASRANYMQESKARRVRTITDGFSSGHLSLADWAANTRTVLTGEAHERQRLSKQDPEVKAAALHLYSHLFKDTGRGSSGAS